MLASRYGGSHHAWLLLRPEASGPVAAMAIGLLRGGLGSTPHWFELEELAAYLTLLVWAHGNLRAVTMAPWHAQRTADSVAASPRRWLFSPPPLPPPS